MRPRRRGRLRCTEACLIVTTRGPAGATLTRPGRCVTTAGRRLAAGVAAAAKANVAALTPSPPPRHRPRAAATSGAVPTMRSRPALARLTRDHLKPKGRARKREWLTVTAIAAPTLLTRHRAPTAAPSATTVVAIVRRDHRRRRESLLEVMIGDDRARRRSIADGGIADGSVIDQAYQGACSRSRQRTTIRMTSHFHTQRIRHRLHGARGVPKGASAASPESPTRRRSSRGRSASSQPRSPRRPQQPPCDHGSSKRWLIRGYSGPLWDVASTT